MWPTISYNPASYYTPSYGGYSSYGSSYGQGYSPYGGYSSYGGYSNPYGGGYSGYSSYGSGYGGYGNSYNPYGSGYGNYYQQAGYNPYGGGGYGYDDFSTQQPAPAPEPKQQPPLDLESLFGPQKPAEPEKKQSGLMGKVGTAAKWILSLFGLYKIANWFGFYPLGDGPKGNVNAEQSDKTIGDGEPTFKIKTEDGPFSAESFKDYVDSSGVIHVDSEGTAQKVANLHAGGDSSADVGDDH